MKAKSFKKISPLFALIMAFVVIISVAFALSITVDGDETIVDEWGVNAQTCTIGTAGCSRVVTDGQDVYDQSSNPYPYYDVDDFHVTNDATNFYMRVDFLGNGTAAQNTFVLTASARPIFTICLDIDNSAATGVTRPAGNCNGSEAMTGVDYYFDFTADEFNPNVPISRFIDCYDGSCAQITPNPLSYGYNADADSIFEIGIPVSAFGVTTGTCAGGVGVQPCTFRVGGFFDNGIEPTDDSIPNSGFATGTFGSGSPTAVTLQDVNVVNTNSGFIFGLVSVLALAVISFGYFVRQRKVGKRL